MYVVAFFKSRITMAIQFAYKVLADLSKAQPEFVLLNYTTWPDAPNGGEEVRAVATITIPDVQTGGRNFGIQLFDPSLNQTIELGAYTKQAGDTTPALLAANAAAAFNLNPFGYPVASVGNVITITAKAGLGALINGAPLVTVGDRKSVV